MIVGSSSAWGQTSYEELFTIKSSDVVTNSSYTAYNTTVNSRDFVITFGGNNKSVGTNSSNRSNCTLSNYSKYAVSPVTTSSIASAFACATSISDVSKISYTINGGSNQTNTNVYLLYSSDNSSFSQVSLTSGTQGASISSGAAYVFEAKTGYFALLFVATNSSGNWRIDDVDVTFYKEASGGGSDPSISASNVNIDQDATGGSIEYTLANATGNVSAEVTSGNWLTLGTVTESAVSFTCSANTGAKRTAQVTLSFTGAENKVVTITQAAKTVATPTFNPEGGTYMQGTGITLTSEGNTIYYTIKTDGSTPSDPTNASTEYSTPIFLGSGTTKIKAIAYDTYGNASSVVTRTYTGIALASLPFSWTGTSTAGKDDLATKTGVVVSLGSNYAESNAPYRLKFDGVGKYVIIYTDEKPEAVYFTAKLYNAATTGSKIKVQGSADGITFTDIEEFTIKGDANATFEFMTSNAFAATHRAVKLVMSSKDQNVGVGTICVSCLPVKITNAEYATYCNATKALDFSNTGITVYTATDNETSVTLNEVTSGKVPANTPVVLYKAGADGTAINVPVIASADAISGTNDLHVSTGTDVKNMYVLAMNPTIGFYPWTGTNLSAGKIYLQGKASYGARSFIGFGGTTGVQELKNSRIDGLESCYDLQGRRVDKPTKGLYIVNGKKVVLN